MAPVDRRTALVAILALTVVAGAAGCEQQTEDAALTAGLLVLSGDVGSVTLRVRDDGKRQDQLERVVEQTRRLLERSLRICLWQHRCLTGISSMVDTWLLLRDVELAGERNRVMYILKSRGMAHSNQLREFLLTDHGADLQDVYVGPMGVLTGSARVAQEMQDRIAAAASRRDVEQRKGQLERKHKAFKARMAELEAAYAAEVFDIEEAITQEEVRRESGLAGRTTLASNRQRTAKGRPASPVGSKR